MGKDYGPTVMVVEDYDDTRALLKSILERKGFRVVEAVNGREAVERAASECPDLILMDLDLLRRVHPEAHRTDPAGGSPSASSARRLKTCDAVSRDDGG